MQAAGRQKVRQTGRQTVRQSEQYHSSHHAITTCNSPAGKGGGGEVYDDERQEETGVVDRHRFRGRGDKLEVHEENLEFLLDDQQPSRHLMPCRQAKDGNEEDAKADQQED